ncbi:MAG: DUF4145 domain-containing protein [Stenotrophomonas sp.]
MLAHHEDAGEVPEDIALSWLHAYQIVRCMGCLAVSFRMTRQTNEDVTEVTPGNWDYVPEVSLFPNPNAGRQPLGDSHLLPSKVRRIYNEALSSLNTDNTVLCGIAIRAIIETVCKEQEAVGGNLASKIDGLVAAQVLTPDGAKILHNLRTLGNAAAHEVIPHSVEELGLGFDVVEHLLQGVYILPKHARRMFSPEGDDEA